ncbi:hypothetical protein [Nitrospira sp. BLG_2]|uniref:hypothetical protein n=1 Tax=Nitrospira sp. BLG_2 TaxID=3397507 RepID=UPI003B9D87F7
MAITPIENLYAHRLRQTYIASTLTGAASTNVPQRRFRVAQYVREVLKRFAPHLRTSCKMVLETTKTSATAHSPQTDC